VRCKEDPFIRIGETNDREIKGNSDVVWSLKDINFEVQPGEVLGIIGRNGAGKSTLLKILSRVTAPTTGTVKVRGRIASLLEVGTGFHPELTGRENIYLNGAILGMRRREVDAKFDEIVDFSGVERYIDTPVKRYSSGMFVRLAFAVAAHLSAEVLIVDEVLAVGDIEFQRKCLSKMGDISRGEGRTVLFVSHNLDAVRLLCSKTLLIDAGEVHYSGDVDNAITRLLQSSKSLLNLKTSITDLNIAPNLQLDKFKINKSEFYPDEPAYIDIALSWRSPNRVTGLSVLIYNEFQTRVGICDLRSPDPNPLRDQELKVSVCINSFNLVSGNYVMGLYIESDLFTNNVMDLIAFKIKERETGFLQYHSAVQGFVRFSFKVQRLIN